MNETRKQPVGVCFQHEHKLYVSFNNEFKRDSGFIVFWRAAAVITTGTFQTRVLRVLSVPEEESSKRTCCRLRASPNRSPNIHMFAYNAELLLKCESLCSFPENSPAECLTAFESPTGRYRSNPAFKTMLLFKHLLTEWKLSQHSYRCLPVCSFLHAFFAIKLPDICAT